MYDKLAIILAPTTSKSRLLADQLKPGITPEKLAK